MIVRYRLPWFFAENDYWTAKYLWEMPIGWTCVDDERSSSASGGFGVFEAYPTQQQHAVIAAYPDVMVIRDPTAIGDS